MVSSDTQCGRKRKLTSQLGVSILDIVRTNPTKLVVHFGGVQGRRLRENYLAMSSEVDGVKVPVMQGLSLISKSYTFRNPVGLLFSTQFAQPAISLMNLAETASLVAKDLVPQNATFAGHSLGEYSSLAGCASVFSVEDLVELTFYRGTVMQNAMTFDAEGRTDYSMMAVNPGRIGKKVTEQDLLSLVDTISVRTGQLLEVVNYNVEGEQYVCAGNVSTTSRRLSISQTNMI